MKIVVFTLIIYTCNHVQRQFYSCLISIELTFTKQFWILKKNLRWCDWSLQRWISSCRQFFSSFSSLYSPQNVQNMILKFFLHVIWFWCDRLETHNSIFSLFAFLNFLWNVQNWTASRRRAQSSFWRRIICWHDRPSISVKVRTFRTIYCFEVYTKQNFKYSPLWI